MKFIRAAWENEFARYLVCGAANTIATYLLYLVLLWITSYEAAYTISYVAGIVLAYYMNAILVFRQPLSWAKALQFPLSYVVQYLTGMGATILLVEKFGMNPAIAPAVVMLVTIPVTFLITRFILKPRNVPPPEVK